MTFEEYQKAAVSFRTESANNEEYLTLGLIAEVGEAAGKLAKRVRDDVWDEKAFIKELGDILWFVANLADYYDREFGAKFSDGLKECFKMDTDAGATVEYTMIRVACYASDTVNECGGYFNDLVAEVGDLACRYGYTLEQVAEINIAKLRDRQSRGVIKGDGDER
ncbi:MAG: MazG nucleotide pyrophosphohydrolase domain-containing protein [Candidatus Merdousia sp.]|nr:MazG nucleotide pyrophosphohydrolase domain-containing protein [Candidatus Merdousia sp.]